MTHHHKAKTCASCGRSFEWRKKWEKNWESVKYCSARCSKNKPAALDRQIESTILSLLEARGAHKTICPSEAVRKTNPDDWRPLMERARQAARRLVDQGKIEITQGGKAVDPDHAKGPIRLRLK